jgi:copper transport protein
MLLRRCAVVIAAFVALVLGAAAPAWAHAQLVGSDPRPGSVLPTQPRQVTLTFGEAVDGSSGGVQVYDDHLRRLPTGAVGVDGTRRQVRVTLPPDLAVGTYTVSWQVTSADTHPASGSFQFSLGAPSQVSGTAPNSRPDPTAGALLDATRSVGYAGLVLGPGVLLVLLALWPAGLAQRRPRVLLSVGLGALAASTLAAMLLQGVWANGLPVSAIWTAPSTLDTHSHRFDLLYALRLLLVLALATATALAVRTAPRTVRRTVRGRRETVLVAAPRWHRLPVRIGVGVLLGAALATWSLAGHPAAGPQSALAVVADMLHIAAVCAWLGGLVLLSVALTVSDRAADLARVLPRFSKLAFACVVVLVVTGTYQAWRDVGWSLGALPGTAFGRLLLVKLAGVLVLLGFGWLARRWLARRLPGTGSTAAPTRAEVTVLRRGLAGELLVGAAVLAFTGILVATVPARQSYVVPYRQTVRAAGMSVGVSVDRPRVGDTQVHLSVRGADGQQRAVSKVTASLVLPARGLGPLPVQVSGTDLRVSFPAAGTWTLRVTVQTGRFDATALAVSIPVAETP